MRHGYVGVHEVVACIIATGLAKADLMFAEIVNEMIPISHQRPEFFP